MAELSREKPGSGRKLLSSVLKGEACGSEDILTFRELVEALGGTTEAVSCPGSPPSETADEADRFTTRPGRCW